MTDSLQRKDLALGTDAAQLPWNRTLAYSARNAEAGSTFDARNAGMAQADAVTATSVKRHDTLAG